MSVNGVVFVQMIDDLYVAKFRGQGPYWASRGGNPNNNLDFMDIPRGDGRFSNIGDFFKRAWQGVKRLVVPYIKSQGPQYARKILELGAQKAADYVEKSNKLGPAKGLVQQALQDLPTIVTSIIDRKINDGEDPLQPEDENYLLSELPRGGNMQEIGHNLVTDAMPIIRAASSVLQQKFDLIDKVAQAVANNQIDHDAIKMFYKLQQKQKEDMMTEDDYVKAIFTETLENMILAALQHADKQNLIAPGTPLYRFLHGGANKVLDKLQESFETSQYVCDRRACMINKKSPLCNGICTLKTSDVDISTDDDDRGGFIGATALATAVLPALIGLVPSITQAISDWKRGSGYNINTDALPNLILAAIGRSRQQKATPKRRSDLLAITAPKRRRR